MTIQFSFGVDWRRKGIICWDAQAGDALNLLPTPITYTKVTRSTEGSGTISLEPVVTDFSQIVFEVATDNGYAGIRLGMSSPSLVPANIDSIVVSPSTQYSVSVWAKGISDYSGVDFNCIIVGNGSGSEIARVSGGAFELNSDWTEYTVTFTTGASDTRIGILFIKNGDSTAATYQLGGVLLVAGSSLPGYNTGQSVDLYDNITNQVLEANWFLGYKKPYQEMPHESMLRLTMDNSDQRFSPEYSDSGNPLKDHVLPLRPVTLRSDDGTTVCTHWSGWLESVTPNPNQYGERRAVIQASGAERFFASVTSTIELQENKRTDEIVARLLSTVTIPPPLTLTTLPDVTGYNKLDETAWVTGSVTIPNNVDIAEPEIGKTTLAYAADNWVRRGNSSDGNDTFNVYRAIQDTVAAERGRFFFDRSGQAIFWNRHNTILNDTIAATFTDTMHDLAYDFASQGEFSNDITVVCHPRSISAGSNELLWSLDEPLRLQPGEEREVGAAYRDDSDNRIGGQNIRLANVSFQTDDDLIDGIVVLQEAGANRSTLSLRNPGTKPAVLESCEVRGQKITDFGQVEAHAVDTPSKSLYGHRDMSLNLLAVDQQDDAQAIAGFELLRRKQPAGKVQSMTVRSHGVDGGNHHAQQLALTIGSRIRISEDQTAHSNEDYFIIGEEHKLTHGGTFYETRWYLESATDTDWFVIDTDSVNDAAVLLPY